MASRRRGSGTSFFLYVEVFRTSQATTQAGTKVAATTGSFVTSLAREVGLRAKIPPCGTGIACAPVGDERGVLGRFGRE